MYQQNGSDNGRIPVTKQPPTNDAAAGADGPKPAAQDKVLQASANLAQLLPTGSVMAYQALSPSFNNHGECYTSNWWLTVSLVTFLTVFCIFFAFTDSITHKGKLYYGVAMKGGLRIFNKEDSDPKKDQDQKHTNNDDQGTTLGAELRKRKLHWLDGVHAFFTAVVFLSVAFSDVGLQKCLFPHAGHDTMELLKNMPLGMSFLSSFVFMIFPTTRHGIGFHDNAESTTAASSKGANVEEGNNKNSSNVAVNIASSEVADRADVQAPSTAHKYYMGLK